MKIEVGKYYKNREGTVVGPIEVNHDDDHPFSAYSGPVFLTYTTEGTWFGVWEDETQEDLVEECNADGSPIVPVEPPASLSWHIPADRSWQQEIALRVLTAMIASPPVCNRAEVDKTKWCGIAFEWADEFIKVANQS